MDIVQEGGVKFHTPFTPVKLSLALFLWLRDLHFGNKVCCALWILVK